MIESNEYGYVHYRETGEVHVTVVVTEAMLLRTDANIARVISERARSLGNMVKRSKCQRTQKDNDKAMYQILSDTINQIEKLMPE